MQIFPDGLSDSIASICLRSHPLLEHGPVCIFALPIDLTCNAPCFFLTSICSEMIKLSSSKGIPLSQVDIRIEQFKGLFTFPTTCTMFHCFIFQTRSFEKIRDKIKRVAWSLNLEDEDSLESVDQTATSEAFLNAFAHNARDDVIRQLSSSAIKRSFNSLGIFWRSTSPALKTISTHSFDHGGGHFYRFRLHREKLSLTSVLFLGLREFLLSIVDDCPNHYFKQGPRVSARKWKFYPSASLISDCDLPRRAAEGIEGRRYKGAHDNVEIHCLENDERTIAVEIPVWWERCEMGPFASCFPPDGPLTGHIDLIRIQDGHVEIWDYKPDIESAQMVGMQVLIYAIAMAVRTKIPLSRFRCGYFDTQYAWSFAPSSVQFKPFSS